MHPSDEKATLRQAIKERMLRLSDEDRLRESRTLCKEILKVLPKDSPLTIGAYFPLKDEADLRPLLDELLARGDALYLPLVENMKMTFRKVENLADLHVGSFGILEPAMTAPLLDPKDLQVCLVPGRAFDRLGNRLGRGNGGYDLWMIEQRKANPKTLFLGIALECQVVHSIPMEPHDQRVDALVTARGMQAIA